ncbi:hypothetical protein LTR36_004418 [Oleoguttula mirabilis]|uniref:Uncharacterized protein n=1 Tax=Oleoguttula mirabilis TaxID=1507867 RepID=A0AAV9JG71_9PEZI|nr:hypothetical protein LTR36_004418 [Oleoguttula mirabilis]
MAEDISPISYEDLAEIEDAFAEVDDEILRRQYDLSRPLYEKRAQAVAKIPSFWPLVMEQAPMEIEDCITHQDSAIFAEHLTNLTVTRPDIEDGKKGNPRSVNIKFEFSPNEHFTDRVLEKRFWYRRASDGWTGLVSEPVKVNWKKGKDSTDGLTSAAVALWNARKKVGDLTAKGLPEYRALEKKVEHWNGANTSFFTWFGWVSGRRYVSAEESEKASQEYAARKEARKHGERSEAESPEDKDEEEPEDDSLVEVHQQGEEIAACLAEDVWPNAIRFFTQAQELDDDPEADFEDDDLDDEDDVDEPIDIRSLVQDKEKGRSRDSSGPPSKKIKT